MKLILIGGSTLGSVSPLIGIWQTLKRKESDLKTLFIGTKSGPEKDLINKYQIPFKVIIAGKFRRYFSLANFLDLFKIVIAFIQSIFILKKFKPDFIISAGGFVAVPLIWAAKFTKAKVILYQSDLKAGLANRLCKMRADYIFTAFSETTKQFPKEKTGVIGSLLRDEIYQAKKKTEVTFDKPKLLILGGGTGSKKINQLVKDSLEYLTEDFNITHVTGEESKIKSSKGNYQSVKLLIDDFYKTLNDADLIISRAGLSTIMELSYLAKPTILIPLPDSPQEANANYLKVRNAAIVLDQKKLTSEKLIEEISKLNHLKKNELAKNIKQIFQHQGAEKIVQKMYELK